MRARWALAVALAACGAPASTPHAPPASPPAPAAPLDEGLPDVVAPLPITPGPLPETDAWADLPADAPLLSRALAEVGVPDPRGGVYRAVAVHVGRDLEDGDLGIVRTRGWVLPARGDGPRWVVTHGGMLYAVAALGRPIPMEPDRSVVGASTPPCLSGDVPHGEEERFVVSCDAGPLALALFARAGAPLSVPSLDDRELAWEFFALAWQARTRALGAHRRGDDVAALHAARLGVAARDRAFALGMSPDSPIDMWASGAAGLELLDALLADQERRAGTPPLDREALDAALAAQAPSEDQIALLIAGLGELPPWGRPSLHDCASVLIRAGPAALPALIDAVERDDRLTRAVHVWRPWAAHRRLGHVRDHAQQSAMVLLDADSLYRSDEPEQGPLPPAERARRLRALADAGLTRRARALAVLRDDAAGAARWYEAARALGSDASLNFEARWIPSSSPGAPALSRLLARRLSASLPRPAGGYDAACHLASSYVREGGRDRRPLRRFRDACLRNVWSCGPCLAGVSAALHELGDPDALSTYAERMRTAHIRGASFNDDHRAPLLRYPDHPAMRRYACWVRREIDGERCEPR